MQRSFINALFGFHWNKMICHSQFLLNTWIKFERSQYTFLFHVVLFFFLRSFFSSWLGCSQWAYGCRDVTEREYERHLLGKVGRKWARTFEELQYFWRKVNYLNFIPNEMNVLLFSGMLDHCWLVGWINNLKGFRIMTIVCRCVPHLACTYDFPASTRINIKQYGIKTASALLFASNLFHFTTPLWTKITCDCMYGESVE